MCLCMAVGKGGVVQPALKGTGGGWRSRSSLFHFSDLTHALVNHFSLYISQKVPVLYH